MTHIPQLGYLDLEIVTAVVDDLVRSGRLDPSLKPEDILRVMEEIEPSAVRSADDEGEPDFKAFNPALPLPTTKRPDSWALTDPDLVVFRCGACGKLWLQPTRCCGRNCRRGAARYYLPASSAPPRRPLSTPEFSVVMPTKNKLELTRVAVESLQASLGKRTAEFIFVDCCSTDGSLAYFQELSRRLSVQVLVTHPEEPFIYARNCNRGAQVARGQYLLFANNDIESRDPRLFDKLARALADSRVGAVGTLTDYDCANDLQKQTSLPTERIWSTKPVMGFLWGVRAEVFAELGGLDEIFRDYGCDEVDFQYRAVQQNYQLAIIDSLVHHELHGTFGSQITAALMRNVRRFNEKHRCRLLDGGRWWTPFLRHVPPRVSVAIASRNCGPYLQRSLDSVLESYLPEGLTVQVVVVNDASTDETAGILEEYRTRYARQLNLITRTWSGGAAVAKNQALARCIGEYVALLDADDEFLELKLWRSVEALQESGADFLYHDFAFVYGDGRHQHHQLGNWSPRTWRENGTFGLPTNTWVFRNGTVEFCENYVTGEDPEFLERRWDTLQVTYLPEVLSRYHIRGDSLSQQARSRVVTGQLKGMTTAPLLGCSDVG